MPKLLNVCKLAMIIVLGRHFKRTPGWIENSTVLGYVLEIRAVVD